MSKGYIYALSDPRNYVVRYIGQTRYHPAARLGHHLTKPSNPQMAAWINELLACDACPQVHIIERASLSELSQREYYWIMALLSHKTPLLNAIDPIRRSVYGRMKPMILCKELRAIKKPLIE